MTRYEWDKIGNTYKWAAKDSDGMFEAYSERPIRGEHSWHSSGFGGTAVLGYSGWWESDSDWEESLEERPNPKPAKRWSLVMGIDGLSTVWDNKMDVALYGAYGDSTAALEKVVEILNEYEEEREDD